MIIASLVHSDNYCIVHEGFYPLKDSSSACLVTVLLNNNFIVTCMSTCGATRNLQCIPVMGLHVPCFLMAWNINVLCNLLYTTCGIVRHGIATHVTAMQGTCLGKFLTMAYCKNAM